MQARAGREMQDDAADEHENAENCDDPPDKDQQKSYNDWNRLYAPPPEIDRQTRHEPTEIEEQGKLDSPQHEPQHDRRREENLDKVKGFVHQIWVEWDQSVFKAQDSVHLRANGHIHCGHGQICSSCQADEDVISINLLFLIA